MENVTTLTTDGGVVGKNPSDFGGTWAFVATDKDDNLVFYRSGFYQAVGQPTTNNHTEMFAAIMALESMPEGWSGTLVSDSQITLGRLFEGWRNKNLPNDLVTRAQKALKRLGTVKGNHVDGHPTKAHLEAGIGKRGNPVSKWNVVADQLCNREVARVKGILPKELILPEHVEPIIEDFILVNK